MNRLARCRVVEFVAHATVSRSGRISVDASSDAVVHFRKYIYNDDIDSDIKNSELLIMETVWSGRPLLSSPSKGSDWGWNEVDPICQECSGAFDDVRSAQLSSRGGMHGLCPSESEGSDQNQGLGGSYQRCIHGKLDCAWKGDDDDGAGSNTSSKREGHIWSILFRIDYMYVFR